MIFRKNTEKEDPLDSKCYTKLFCTTWIQGNLNDSIESRLTVLGGSASYSPSCNLIAKPDKHIKIFLKLSLLREIKNTYSKKNESHCNTTTVHARMKLVQERQFQRAPVSARAIALNFFGLHVRFKICVSEIQSFTILKHVRCLTQDKTG